MSAKIWYTVHATERLIERYKLYPDHDFTNHLKDFLQGLNLMPLLDNEGSVRLITNYYGKRVKFVCQFHDTQTYKIITFLDLKKDNVKKSQSKQIRKNRRYRWK